MAENRKLSYYLPKLQKPHTVLRIPGSHTIFVGPPSCMRRHYLHAYQYGDIGHVSFLQITNADIISGAYHGEMLRTVAELNDILEPKPHIYIFAVFCIDDFLGTDEAALLSELAEAYPECRFAVEHIAPLNLDEDKSRVMKKKSDHYSFLRPEKEHDRGVVFLGSFVPLEPECEFNYLLEKWGVGPIRELFNCKSYEEYQAMAKSCLAIGMRSVSGATAKFFREKLNIPFYSFLASYDAKAIEKAYGDIARLTGNNPPDLTLWREEAEKDAEETAALIRGMPVAIDSKATLMPFTTALTLLNYGFNIRYVFHSRKPFADDAPAMEKLKEAGVVLQRSDEFPGMEEKSGRGDCLAIGSECARLLGAKHFADVWHDEGYFGFHGIHRLMATLRNAAETEVSEE